MASPRSVEPRLRHARAAVSAVFFVNAVLYANLVPRLPEIKDRLDLTNAALGAGIAAMPAGALVAGLLAPAFIQRFGSAKVASLGLVGLSAAVLWAPLAGSWALFAAAMFVAGALDAVVDVGQNAQGLRVQRLYGRSIINSFHALWSVGAVVGGLLGSAAAGLRLPLPLHLTVSAVVFSIVAVVAYGYLLPGPEREGHASTKAGVTPGPRGRRRVGLRAALLLAALGTLAACEAFVQDAGATWAALYMRTEVGADAATAGLAFVALQAAITAGRVVGDRVVDHYGQRRVARAGGAAIALGMGTALAIPSAGTTLAGFALVGLGVATLVPAVFHAADELPGLPPGVGLTIVGWLLRVGFLISPAIVGVLADAVSLRAALLSVVAAGLVVVLLGRVLDGGRADPHRPDRPTSPAP